MNDHAAASIALITARGGSKGVPRKNVRSVAGRPLIAWTIEAARSARSVERVVVSTDDSEIVDVCRRWEVDEFVDRPPHLATDTASHEDVLVDAVERLAERGPLPELLVLLQPTSPLRTAADIDAAVSLAERTGASAVVTVSRTPHHPYLARRLESDGHLTPFIEDTGTDVRRQAFPPAYVLNGAVYVFKTRSILDQRRLPEERPLGLEMPPERAIDIDTETDLVIADALLRVRDADAT